MNIFHGNGPALAAGFEECPGIPDTLGDTPVYPRQNLLQSYLSVPFYAAGAWLFGEEPTIPGRGLFWNIPWGPLFFVSMLNPLLAALTAILVALLGREFGLSPPRHYQLALMYGLTSMIWHYSGLGMEVVQTAILTSAIYAAVKYRFSGKIKWLVIASVLLLALPNCKKHTFIFVVPIAIYLFYMVARKNREKALLITGILGFSAIAGTVIMITGMLIRFRADPNLFPHLLGSFLSGGFKSVDLIFGLTLSPGEGLLIYNPLLWFCVPAWGIFYRKYRSEAILFGSVAAVLLLALWKVPFVLIDEEWGPRYLLCLTPLMFVAGAEGLFRERKKFMKAVFISVLISGFIIGWLSSLYLGFKVLDAAVDMGVDDYFVIAFTPSMSQIWLTVTCFGSHLKYMFTGRHSEISHRQYHVYTGLGGYYETLRKDLRGYDYPSGGLFVVRWVLSEKGIHGLNPTVVFIIKLITDCLLVGVLLILVKTRKNSLIESPVG